MKYTYYLVIQQNWGNSWDDVDLHECNSQGMAKDRAAFRENLRLYRMEQSAPVRVVSRKELRA